MDTVFWDEWNGSLVFELEARMQEALASLRVLRHSRTVGDVRRAELAGWAQSGAGELLEDIAEELGVDVDDVPDSAAWRGSDIDGEYLIDAIPMRHDADRAVEWLDRHFLAEHADIGGGSPGGHIDTYTVRDRGVFFAALRERGYELQHYSGLMQAYGLA